MKRQQTTFIALICILLSLLVAPAVLAQEKSVTVERRDGSYTIASDGTVQVIETWRVRFSGGPFRFAFRSIPLNRVQAIDGWGVREAGRAYREASGEASGTFTLDSENNERKITWYFDQTSDATRTFELRYTLHGALRIYPGGDQLFWKFIESDRAYTIEAARVVVTLPANFNADQIRSTTYRNATEEAESSRTLGPNSVEFVGGPFPSNTEWEIRTTFPHGVVTSAVPAWQAADEARQSRIPALNLATLVLSFLSGLGGSVGLYLFWYRRGRDTPTGVAPAYLTAPPDESPPAVVGTLIDEDADMKDITATLVDLARRGYLNITERKNNQLFSSTEYIFVRGTAELPELRPYEQKLFDRLFGGIATECSLSSLRDSFYTIIPSIQQDMYDEVVQAGYFPERPNETRNRYTSKAIIALLLSIGLLVASVTILSDELPLLPLLAFTLLVLSIGGMIISRYMPRKTAAGVTAAAKWVAFQRYLKDIERYTEVASAREQYDRYLPYAIVFGIEKEWTNKFIAVDTPAPFWYYPYGLHPYRYHSYDYDDSNATSGSPMMAPSLDQAASSSFTSLNAMSSGLFNMLNMTAGTLSSEPSSSSSSDGGGGGGGGGGGSSGFG
jgi:uncharacterized membrane protein